MDHIGGSLLMEFANQPSPVAMTTGQPSYQSTPDTASRKRHREDGGGSSGEDGEGEYDDVKLGSGAAVGGQGKSDRPLQRSCEECKRRKVKCDRQIPCGNCTRRGTSSACSAESAQPRAPRKNNYALATDVEQLTKRLADVEKLLRIRPNPSYTSAPSSTSQASALVAGGPHSANRQAPQPANSLGLGSESTHFHPPTTYPHQRQHTNPHRANSDLSHSHPSTPSVLQHPHRDSPVAMGSVEHEVDELDSDPDTNLEQAATSLEAAAYAPPISQKGANHSAVESLPFFDNLRPGSYHEKKRSGQQKEAADGSIEMELTAGLTSIVAPSIESWWSCAAEMGLDLLAETEEDVAAARRKALADILRLVPTKEDSFLMVGKYFSDSPSWILQSTQQIIFVPEHERFWEMVEQGRQLEVDCLWLSVYFMVLALAHAGGFRGDLPTPPRHASAPASVYYGAARRLLHLGDWSGAPRIRTIQSVVLMSQWVQTASIGGEAGRLLTWLAGAIRVAQALGLHQLGDNPQTMPPDDPAFPPGKNARKRQMALRLFASLRLIDYSTSSRYRAYLLHPNHITTSPIDNVDLAAASPTDWVFEPLPRDQITDASFEFAKWTMVSQALLVFETLTNKSTFSYETVLSFDAGYRKILAELPPVWQAQPSGAGADTPEMRWKRHACQEAIHNRLAKLHRPFLTRGFHEGSPYRFSSEECVASARIVISSHHGIMDVTNSSWFSYSHALTSALILFADLFNAIDSGLPGPQLDQRSEFLVLAYTIFSRHSEIQSAILKGIAQRGAKVISGLFMAKDKRLRLRDNGGGAPPETFAQILQQITRDLDTKSPAQPTARLDEQQRPFFSSTSSSAPLSATALASRLNPFTSAQVYPQQQQGVQVPPPLSQQSYPPPPPTSTMPLSFPQVAPRYTGQFDPTMPSFGAPAPPQQQMVGIGGAGLEDQGFGEGMFDWSWLDVAGDGSLLAGAGVDGGAMAGVAQFDEVMSGW